MAETSDDAYDINQVLVLAPTGKSNVPTSNGGNFIWEWENSASLASDMSQSFIRLDFEVRPVIRNPYTTTVPTVSSEARYFPTPFDFHPDAALRAFDKMTWTVEGVTLEMSNNPWQEKRYQRRYLMDHNRNNMSNFAAHEHMASPGYSVFDHPANGLSIHMDTFAVVNPWKQRPFMMATHTGVIDPGLAVGNPVPTWEQAQRICKASDYWAAIPDYGSDTNAYYWTEDMLTQPIQHTVYFQPPFDSWAVHQRISGGHNKLELHMKPTTTETVVYPTIATFSFEDYRYNLDKATEVVDTLWGSYMTTPARDGLYAALSQVLGYNANWGTYSSKCLDAVDLDDNKFYKRSMQPMFAAIELCTPLAVDFKQINFQRRAIRTKVQRPIKIQEFNITRMQLLYGTPSTSGVTNTFVLPSSAYGAVFHWTRPTDPYHDNFNDYKRVDWDRWYTYADDGYESWVPADGQEGGDLTNYPDYNDYYNQADGCWALLKWYDPQLTEFYFRYGGKVIPEQRLDKMMVTDTQTSAQFVSNSSVPLTTYAEQWKQLHRVSFAMQGMYNTPHHDQPFTYNDYHQSAGFSEQMYYFPLSRHEGSDNADLQVTWNGSPSLIRPSELPDPALLKETCYVKSSELMQLCICVFFETRIEFIFDSTTNRLQSVRVTEWR